MKRLAFALPAALVLSLPCLPAAPADRPAPVKPLNLPVNTPADEDEPHAASNGLTLYYAANAKGKFDLMISQRRSVRKPWGPGEVLQDYIQTPADDRGAYVTAAGRYPQYLYYATKKDKDGTNFDIYVAVRQGDDKAFAEPTPLHAIDTETDEMHPWITLDGRHLYFSRRTGEGLRVFVASRPRSAGAQGFGPPTLVQDLSPDFCHATLTPDGRTMYLQGPLDKGRTGLFVTTRNGSGWRKPQPLDQLNDPAALTGDRSPNLSRDGALLYFASDRPGGKGGLDLWVIPTAQLKIKR